LEKIKYRFFLLRCKVKLFFSNKKIIFEKFFIKM